MLILCRPPKRQSSKAPSLSKKVKNQEEQQDELIGAILSFKNADYLANKGEQKKKKWKNLKQILDMPSSFTGPESFENYSCIIFMSDMLIVIIFRYANRGPSFVEAYEEIL
jgi:hypothetical protein